MIVRYLQDYDEMSQVGADLVIQTLQDKPEALICAATGQSPLGVYRELGIRSTRTPATFSRMQLLKLDEWGEVPATHPASCEHYLRQHLIQQLAITEDRYFGFQPATPHPSTECSRMGRLLESQGPIDLCVLGLGKNGHLGFIEPAAEFNTGPHIASLADSTKQHTMLDGLDSIPVFGLTLGIDDLVRSRQILLLVTGQGKEEVSKRLLSGKISTWLPASFLWMHSNVQCLIDNQAIG